MLPDVMALASSTKSIRPRLKCKCTPKKMPLVETSVLQPHCFSERPFPPGLQTHEDAFVNPGLPEPDVASWLFCVQGSQQVGTTQECKDQLLVGQMSPCSCRKAKQGFSDLLCSLRRLCVVIVTVWIEDLMRKSRCILKRKKQRAGKALLSES